MVQIKVVWRPIPSHDSHKSMGAGKPPAAKNHSVSECEKKKLKEINSAKKIKNICWNKDKNE